MNMLCLVFAISLSTFAFADDSIYRVVSTLAEQSCGMGKCSIEMNQVHCTWPNAKDLKDAKCEFKNAAGERKVLSGIKARDFITAINEQKEIQTDCGAGTCGFSSDQDVSCVRSNGPGLNKPTCTVSEHKVVEANKSESTKANPKTAH